MQEISFEHSNAQLHKGDNNGVSSRMNHVSSGGSFVMQHQSNPYISAKQRNGGRLQSETKFDEGGSGYSQGGLLMMSPSKVNKNEYQLSRGRHPQQINQQSHNNSLYNQLQAQSSHNRNLAAGMNHNTSNADQLNMDRMQRQQQLYPQSDRMFSSGPSYGLKGASTDIDDPLNDSSVVNTSGALVSYKRFRNSAGVQQATNSVRKSLGEMTYQFKKSKEMHELMLERKNIENMIVNSKLWSPPMPGNSSKFEGGVSTMQVSMRSTEMNQPCTSNVFRDKREELTKILKKRLNYIHQQSSHNANQGNMKTQVAGTTGNNRVSAAHPLSSSPQMTHGGGRRSQYHSQVATSPNFKKLKSSFVNMSSVDQMQQSFDFNNQTASKEDITKDKEPETKLPAIEQQKTRHNVLVPGKGGNPFMIKNKELMLEKKSFNQKPSFIQTPKKVNTKNNEALEAHVDAVIADQSFKRGLQEQINHSVQVQQNQTKLESTIQKKAGTNQTLLQNLDTTITRTNAGIIDSQVGSTSVQRQMVYQTDFQNKIGQINKRMDEELESIDQALEHLKLKKPHQFGLPFSMLPSPTHSPLQNAGQNQSNPFHKQKPKAPKAGQGILAGVESGLRSDSLNYISVIKSNIDMVGDFNAANETLNDINIEDQLQLDHIQNFAIMLMRQRRALQGHGLNREDSFNTEMGMAFSAKNDIDEFNQHQNDQESDEQSDEDGVTSPKTTAMGSSQAKFPDGKKSEMVLEIERDIKTQEVDFVKKIQSAMINEFQLTGTVQKSQRQSMESLYAIKKKKSLKKTGTAEEIPQHVEEYMKNMKTQTLEALTFDVKARNSFFQFIRHHQSAVFGEKFTQDPKLNYFLSCNKEFVTALPIVSKIQGKTLNLVGYRLNLGVCKAIRTFLQSFKNAITKVLLDNNGMNTGDDLTELLHGVMAQEDFKQIVIIRNSVDDNSTSILVEILKRSFPKALEELRIVNCKISPVSTHKILTSINDGSSSLRKLTLAGAQISEQSLGLLANIVAHVRSLMDLDISWNGLRPNGNLKKFLDALGGNRSLQYLNLSWNNLMLPPVIHKDPQPQPGQTGTVQTTVDSQKPGEGGTQAASIPQDGSQQTAPGGKKPKEEKLDEYTQHLLDNLLRFIKYNKHLIHLDLSYTRLDEMMIKALGTALRRAKSLVAVHFSGNPGVTEENVEYLHQRVHCRPHRDRQMKKENQALLQTMYNSSPRQNKAFEGVQIKQILQKQRMVKNTTGGQSFKPEIDEGNYLQFQRWLGHKYEIPMSGQWQLNTALQEIKDQCWVCNKWCYTIVYWSPTVQASISRTVKQSNDYEDCEVDQVRHLIRESAIPQSGQAPKIAGSFTNWELMEMIPLITFCEAIDTNKPDPIQILKKQGRVRDEVEKEEDLKTDKEKLHLQRIKDQIKQDYKLKWKASIMKSLKYKKACHINIEFATEVDQRHEDVYVFATFGCPGQHVYYVQDNTNGNEHVNKCIVPLREEDIPIHEKINRFKIQQRVFKKDASVFKDWKDDTPLMLQNMVSDDFKWWKVGRFIKDDTDRERVEKLLARNYLKIKKIFTSFISQSSFPNISWIDFGNFCEKCKIIDGKGVILATVDRAFIAANVAVEGQKLSEDNPTNALSRFEFLEILVRLAQSKFKETGICATYEESMQKLLDEHVFPLANPEPWQEFRDELLWTIDVNDVLEVNLEGLKKVYTNYHEPRKKFMTMSDALSLMMRDTALNLIEKDAIYCFGMCKMSVIYEQENMWQYKQLKFVELLELIGRIAHQKFKDHPELHESMSLAQKIEHVLDVVFKLVDVTRKDVQNNVVEESESDDDY